MTGKKINSTLIVAERDLPLILKDMRGKCLVLTTD